MSADYFYDGLMVIGPRHAEGGKSAYAYAVEGGYIGTEKEFGIRLAALLNGVITATVDTDTNRITLSGALDDGTYTAYYEVQNDDGTKSLVEIGELTLGEEETPDPDPDPEPDEPETATYFIDTTYLVACSSGNTNTEVEGGSAYTTTISADEGYNLSAIRVKMGVEDITSDAVQGSTVTIPNVTGHIAVSCVGYKTGIRIYHGDGKEQDNTIADGTGFIPVKTGDTVYIKNISVDTSGNCGLAYYDADKTYISGYYLGGGSGIGGAVNGEVASFSVTAANASYIRFSALVIDSTSIITVNEPLT